MVSSSSSASNDGPRGIRICIDRGGTFTDCIGFVPDASQASGYRTIVLKVLSVDPAYPDAPREGIRKILEIATGRPHPRSELVPTDRIESIRMGTTVATNALLERKGEPCALLITKGFRDLLHIGNQSRPDIFDLKAECPEVLYEEVVEVDERVTLVGYTCSPLGAKVKPPSESDPDYAKGITGEWIHVLKRPDVEAITKQLKAIREKGINSVAICLMHSYTYPDHEKLVAKLASSLGFSNVTLSSHIMPMIKIVPRGTSATVDAYLTPCIQRYIDGFFSGFDEGIRSRVRVEFMQSDGGLAPVGSFSGFRAILSGPAGGVVGYAVTSYDPDEGSPVIGFDMGGTSTDVSRFAGGRYEHVFETTTAGVTIQAPQLDINTVAAGGGSRLFFRNGLFVVGPESASAHPGPACYRKGGPLAITDANLFLGRLVPLYFPKIFGPNENEPLDLAATTTAFEALAKDINDFQRASGAKEYSLDEIAFGFVEVANEAMSRPIRTLTQAKGYDTSQHVLACFGGAGAQHACAIARGLGIGRILVHRYASILSAYGLSLADVVQEVQEPAQINFGPAAYESLGKSIEGLKQRCIEKLESQGFKKDGIDVEVFLNLRYQGTDTAMMTLQPEDGSWGFDKVFVAQYQQEFGFTLPERAIIVDDIRVRGIGRSFTMAPRSVYKEVAKLPRRAVPASEAVATTQAYWGPALGRKATPVFDLTKLSPGDVVSGPAIVVEPNSVIVVETACEAIVATEHVLIEVKSSARHTVGEDLDPIQLSIFSHRFMSIAEQMGHTLQRTSVSTNIKERLDFSCALFGPDGGLVSNAPHIPVHLGSMQEAVKYQIDFLKDDLTDGDVIVSNHPNAGGSHLPDITVITPVFENSTDKAPVFFVASRGHHADIGGLQPGSMPPFSKELFQEGAAIKSFKLVQHGVFDEPGIIKRLVDEPGSYPGCSGTRILKDNLSDLKAQVAANQKGINLVRGLIKEYTLPVVQAYMRYIRENAELAVRDLLMKMYARHGNKRRLDAEDFMDDGTPIKLVIDIDPEKREAVFDFTGTGPEVYGNTNAPKAITYSAIIYCLRALVGQDIPLNQGCLAPIKIIIPEGSLLSPGEGAAVVGGNVLTSQRLVDVVLLAFGACAASQGCMNNLTFGAQAQDVGEGNGWGYYETIAGGAGAGPTWDGRSGVHTHMTNTRITDPEILERRYPVILREFGLRQGSGGAGLHPGGDGVIRDIEFLEPVDVNILSERRVMRPYGMAGGEDGQAGRNLLIKVDSKTGEVVKVLNLGGKNTVKVRPHDRFRLEAPGGGGYGAVSERKEGQAGKEATSAPYRKSGSVLQRNLDAYSV